MLPGLGAIDYLEPWMAAARMPVTVLDLLGYRGGRAASCRPRIADIAARCAGWLTATGRRGVVLAGHSTGAQCAIRVAASCPDRVAHVVLVAPTFVPAARTVGGLLWRLAPTLAREDPREARRLLPPYLRSGGWPVARLLRDGVRDEPEAAAGAVPVPVSLVCGSRDGLAPPSWGRRLADLAGGRVAVVPGAHNFCYTQAEDLAGTCEALLAL